MFVGVSSQKPDAGADHETEGTSLDYEAADSGGPSTFRPPFWAAKYEPCCLLHLSIMHAGNIVHVFSLSGWVYLDLFDNKGTMLRSSAIVEFRELVRMAIGGMRSATHTTPSLTAKMSPKRRLQTS